MTQRPRADSLRKDDEDPMNLSGVFPPVPTPFDSATGEFTPAALTANINRLLRAPVAGVLVLGSNGEAGLLDETEADRVVAAARAVVPAGRTLLVGAGRESTRATIAACVRAAGNGADSVLVRAPSFFKAQMTHEALVTHYRAVADASPVPVMLYNVPGMAGFSLTVPMVRTLAAHANVIGIKETSNDLERLGQFAAITDSGFDVLVGWAPVAHSAAVAGARGAIIAVANVLPDVCTQLWSLATAGRHAEALVLQRRITTIAQLVSSVHGVAGLKCALDLVGAYGGPVRAPLLPVTAAVAEDIRSALAPWQA
ncbi:MAG TPA: dihydrodipicolinate synthase family protein [Vicinamibacterales bacterium]|nr:dihydrodipicolinate synthase family protein [Vicinamibacterales bacterium]